MTQPPDLPMVAAAEGPQPNAEVLAAEATIEPTRASVQILQPVVSPDGTIISGQAWFNFADGSKYQLLVRSGIFCCECGAFGFPQPCEHAEFYLSELERRMGA